MSAVIMPADWQQLRIDRLAHGGVFAWYVKCLTHGQDFQAGCLSCGMAQGHNGDITRELLTLGLIWLWDEPAGDIPMTPISEDPALRGDQESAS